MTPGLMLAPSRSSSIFTAARVIVMSENESLSASLRRAIHDRGGQSVAVTDHAQLLSELAQRAAHAVVLDVGHEPMASVPIMRDVREMRAGQATTVMAAARVNPGDPAIIRVLREGIDDVIEVPSGLPQFSARLSARLRRARALATTGGGLDLWPSYAADCIIVGPIEVRPASHIALIDGQELQLSASEFALLEVLAQHAGEVLSRERIISLMHNDEDPPAQGSDRSVDSMIYLLRKRLGKHGTLIRSKRGMGYMLAAPVRNTQL